MVVAEPVVGQVAQQAEQQVRPGESGAQRPRTLKGDVELLEEVGRQDVVLRDVDRGDGIGGRGNSAPAKNVVRPGSKALAQGMLARHRHHEACRCRL